jgi:hypothetical protein
MKKYARTKHGTVSVGTRLDKKLVDLVSKQMKVDRAKADIKGLQADISWRILFETALKDYLKENKVRFE